MAYLPKPIFNMIIDTNFSIVFNITIKPNMCWIPVDTPGKNELIISMVICLQILLSTVAISKHLTCEFAVLY